MALGFGDGESDGAALASLVLLPPALAEELGEAAELAFALDAPDGDGFGDGVASGCA